MYTLPLLLVGWTPICRADDTPPVEPAPTTVTPPEAIPAHRIWYGWQTLSVVAVAGAAADITFRHSYEAAAPLLIVGSAMVFTGPIVHLAHHDRRHAAVSLAGNIIIPGAAAIGLTAMANCTGGGADICANLVPIVGALGGGAVAVLIDASLLSWKPALDTPMPAAPTVTPALLPTHDGAALVLQGRF